MSNGRYKGPRRGPVEPTKSSRMDVAQAQEQAVRKQHVYPPVRKQYVSTPGWTPYTREEVEAAMAVVETRWSVAHAMGQTWSTVFELTCNELGIRPTAVHKFRYASDITDAILWELR